MAVDIENLSTLADPYPGHAELRDRGAHRLDDGRWIVARAEDVERVLLDSTAIIGFDASDAAATIQSRMARFTDGAAHPDRRAVATSTMQRLDVAALERGAAELANGRLGDLGGGTDIMATLARAVPIEVLATAMGIDGSGAAEAAIELALAIAPPRGRVRGDAEAPVRRICAAIDAATALSDADINTAALLFQAVDATAGLIGNSIVTASRVLSPADASPLDFVREVSRFDPAVHFTTRRAAGIEVGAARIPTGSTIVVDLAAANRDPTRWPDADVFRPSRNAPSFAFGDGAHRCPGRDVALALAAGVFAAVIATGGRLTDDAIAYEPRFNLRVPAQLNWIVGSRSGA